MTEQDVNDRYDVASVSCRWLPGDEKLAGSAGIVRVLVDGNLADDGNSSSAANLRWQPGVWWKVEQFLASKAPGVKVVLSPAGMMTTDLGETPPPTVSGVATWLARPDTELQCLLRELEELGCLNREMLLGIDGCQGRALPIQTIGHLAGKPEISLGKTTMKLYPTAKEQRSLLGWQICKNEDTVPPELAAARLVQTQAGPILVLVCFDVKLMRGSANSPVPHGGQVAEAIGDHFWQIATGDQRPRYVLIAAHWHKRNLNRRVGTLGFIEAAQSLAQELSQSTIVTTMFAPHHDLAELAGSSYFPVLGSEPRTVATLLVEDSNALCED